MKETVEHFGIDMPEGRPHPFKVNQFREKALLCFNDCYRTKWKAFSHILSGWNISKEAHEFWQSCGAEQFMVHIQGRF